MGLEEIRILHLSATDEAGAIRTMEAMTSVGLYNKMVVKGKKSNNSNVIELPLINKLTSYIDVYINRFLTKLCNTNGMFTFPILGVSGIRKLSLYKESRVIYLHFTAQSCFLSLSTIMRILNDGKKLVISTRDAWFFTGGCHMSIFTSNCSNEQCSVKCPNINILGMPLIRYFYKGKRKVLAHNNIYINYNSFLTKKLIHQLLGYSFFNGEKEFIAYNPIEGINQFIELENHNKNQLVIGFVSRDLTEPRKGIERAVNQLIQLNKSMKINIQINLLGRNRLKVNSEIINYFEYTEDNNKISNFYKGLDIYFNPSLAETFGNTTIEASLNGCFVIGIDDTSTAEILNILNTGCTIRNNYSEQELRNILENYKFQDRGEIIRKTIQSFGFESVGHMHKNYLLKNIDSK